MSNTTTSKNFKRSPSKEYRFFLYCPDEGLTFWKTEQDRNEAAELVITGYLDGEEWSDEVTQVVAGLISHQAVETDVVERVGELDEDGCDEVGEYWQNSDWTRKCNYALRPFQPTETIDE